MGCFSVLATLVTSIGDGNATDTSSMNPLFNPLQAWARVNEVDANNRQTQPQGAVIPSVALSNAAPLVPASHVPYMFDANAWALMATRSQAAAKDQMDAFQSAASFGAWPGLDSLPRMGVPATFPAHLLPTLARNGGIADHGLVDALLALNHRSAGLAHDKPISANSMSLLLAPSSAPDLTTFALSQSHAVQSNQTARNPPYASADSAAMDPRTSLFPASHMAASPSSSAANHHQPTTEFGKSTTEVRRNDQGTQPVVSAPRPRLVPDTTKSSASEPAPSAAAALSPSTRPTSSPSNATYASQWPDPTVQHEMRSIVVGGSSTTRSGWALPAHARVDPLEDEVIPEQMSEYQGEEGAAGRREASKKAIAGERASLAAAVDHKNSSDGRGGGDSHVRSPVEGSAFVRVQGPSVASKEVGEVADEGGVGAQAKRPTTSGEDGRPSGAAPGFVPQGWSTSAPLDNIMANELLRGRIGSPPSHSGERVERDSQRGELETSNPPPMRRLAPPISYVPLTPLGAPGNYQHHPNLFAQAYSNAFYAPGLSSALTPPALWLPSAVSSSPSALASASSPPPLSLVDLPHANAWTSFPSSSLPPPLDDLRQHRYTPRHESATLPDSALADLRSTTTGHHSPPLPLPLRDAPPSSRNVSDARRRSNDADTARQSPKDSQTVKASPSLSRLPLPLSSSASGTIRRDSINPYQEDERTSKLRREEREKQLASLEQLFLVSPSSNSSTPKSKDVPISELPESDPSIFRFKTKTVAVTADEILQATVESSEVASTSDHLDGNNSCKDTRRSARRSANNGRIRFPAFHTTRTSSLTEEGLAWGQTKCDTKGIPKSQLEQPQTNEWFHTWQLNRRVIAKWLDVICSKAKDDVQAMDDGSGACDGANEASEAMEPNTSQHFVDSPATRRSPLPSSSSFRPASSSTGTYVSDPLRTDEANLGQTRPGDSSHGESAPATILANALLATQLNDLLIDICKYFSTDFEGSFTDFVLDDVPFAQDEQVKLDAHQHALRYFLALIDTLHTEKEDEKSVMEPLEGTIADKNSELAATSPAATGPAHSATKISSALLAKATATSSSSSSPKLINVATSYFNCASRKSKSTVCGAKLNARVWYNVETREFVETVEGAKKKNRQNVHSATCTAMHKSRLPPSLSTIRIVDTLLTMGYSITAVEEFVYDLALKRCGRSPVDDGRLIARCDVITKRQMIYLQESSKHMAMSASAMEETRDGPNESNTRIQMAGLGVSRVASLQTGVTYHGAASMEVAQRDGLYGRGVRQYGVADVATFGTSSSVVGHAAGRAEKKRPREEEWQDESTSKRAKLM